jgi:RNA polymerase sporulation-specific sigma factor
LSPRSGVVALESLHDDALVTRAQEGDDLAQQALIQRYRRLASSRTRGYYLPGGDADDIVQEALIGLYKAVRDYRSDRQASFRGFAEICITRQVLTAVKTAGRRKHQPLNHYVSISLPRDEDPDECDLERVLVAHQVVGDPADHVVADGDAADVDQRVASVLSGFEVDVLKLFVAGESYQEIGALLGRQVKSVDNALQRIKRKLAERAPRGARLALSE